LNSVCFHLGGFALCRVCSEGEGEIWAEIRTSQLRAHDLDFAQFFSCYHSVPLSPNSRSNRNACVCTHVGLLLLGTSGSSGRLRRRSIRLKMGTHLPCTCLRLCSAISMLSTWSPGHKLPKTHNIRRRACQMRLLWTR